MALNGFFNTIRESEGTGEGAVPGYVRSRFSPRPVQCVGATINRA